MATENEKERWIKDFLHLDVDEYATLNRAYTAYREKAYGPNDYLKWVEGVPIIMRLIHLNDDTQLVYDVPKRRVYLIACNKIICDWECTYEQMVGVLDRSDPATMLEFMKDMALIWGGVAI